MNMRMSALALMFSLAACTSAQEPAASPEAGLGDSLDGPLGLGSNGFERMPGEHYFNFHGFLMNRLPTFVTGLPQPLQTDIQACIIDAMLSDLAPPELAILDTWARGDAQVPRAEFDRLVDKIGIQKTPEARLRILVQTCPDKLDELKAYVAAHVKPKPKGDGTI
ncbi:MAG TPA: hypothetical protein VGM59_05715 [Dongiaceae bacterium]|jgi:hypothetical protein